MSPAANPSLCRAALTARPGFAWEIFPLDLTNICAETHLGGMGRLPLINWRVLITASSGKVAEKGLQVQRWACLATSHNYIPTISLPWMQAAEYCILGSSQQPPCEAAGSAAVGPGCHCHGGLGQELKAAPGAPRPWDCTSGCLVAALARGRFGNGLKLGFQGCSLLQAPCILLCRPSVMARMGCHLSILKSGVCLQTVSSSWLWDAVPVLEASLLFLLQFSPFPKLEEERGPRSSPPAFSQSQTLAQVRERCCAIPPEEGEQLPPPHRRRFLALISCLKGVF